jgi:formylglycine-generating enzyme required for sulfatase activity
MTRDPARTEPIDMEGSSRRSIRWSMLCRNFFRAYRGGSWMHSTSQHASAFRAGNAPDNSDKYYGFRVARNAREKE